MTGPYRRDIDGLRALAVLAVVVFHAFPALIPNGYVGVDIFFVISGYLIGGIILAELGRGTFSFVNFYKRRIRRLLPALFVVYVVTVAAGALILAPGDFNTLTLTLRASVLLGSNFLFAGRTGYFDQAASEAPFVHTWSLSVEEQFYLVAPLLLWLVFRRRPGALGKVLLGLAVLSFATAIDGAVRYPAKAFFWPHTRAWELLAGVLLAWHHRKLDAARAPAGIAGLLGLSAIAGSIWLPYVFGPFDTLVRVTLACAGAVALVEAGRDASARVPRLLSQPPFVWIGLISYPLYLWHWPVLVYARMFAADDLSWPASAACVAVSVALAEATRRWIEAPLRFGTAPSTRQVYGAFAVSAVLLIGFSLVSETTKGLPQRFSPEIRGIFATVSEWRSSPRFACFNAGDGPTIEQRMAAGHPCRLGVPDKPLSAVLWGDSHAAAMMPGFGRWLAEQGMAGVAVVGCRPVDTWMHGAECAALARATLERIAASEAKTVVLVNRWTNQVEGPMPLERGYRTLSAQERGERQAALSGQLRGLVDRLRQAGKTVIVVRTVPEMPFSAPNLIGVRLALGLSLPPGPTVAELGARRAEANAALDSALAGTGVVQLEPVQTFCGETCAYVTADRKSLYFDSNHLSVYAADRVTAMFAAQMPPGLLP